MKKVLERWKSIFNVLLICLLMMFLSPSHCFSQLQKDTYEYHMEMAAKKQKRSKKLLIIGGSGILVGSSIAAISSISLFPPGRDDKIVNDSSTLGLILITYVVIGGGTIVSLISIPQFISAKNHRKKAISLQPVVQPVNVSGSIGHTIGLRMTF